LEKERLRSNDVTGKRKKKKKTTRTTPGERNRSSHCPFHTTGGHSAKRVTIPEHGCCRNPEGSKILFSNKIFESVMQ
jgi:hypothetical protein